MASVCGFEVSGIVYNDNGTESKLYSGLLELVKNKEKALELFMVSTSESFRDVVGKVNVNDSVSLDELLQYVGDLNIIEQPPLSPVEKLQIDELANNLGFNSLSSLRDTLNNLLFKDGGFTAEKAVLSGIFSLQDVESADIELLETMYGRIDKYIDKFGDVEYNSAEEANYKDSGNISILGTHSPISENQIIEQLIDGIDNFQNRDEINQAVLKLPYSEFVERFNEDDNFKNEIYSSLEKKRRVPLFHIDMNGRLTNNATKTFIELKNTLSTNINFNKMFANLDFVLRIHDDIWESKKNDVRSVLKRVEKVSAENGFDIVGVSDQVDNMNEVKAFVSSVLDFADNVRNNNITEESIREFSDSVDTYLGRQSKNDVIEVQDKDTKSTYVKLHTTLAENELFDKYGLIKVDDNLYRKVNIDDLNIDSIYDLLYQRFVEGTFKVPSNVKKKDYKTLEGLAQIKSDIKDWALNQKSDINTENKELYILTREAFENPIKQRTKDNRSEDSKKIGSIRVENIDYLKTDFISDFYKYYLSEKVQNSYLYKSLLKEFSFTDKGIDISDNVASLEGVSEEMRNHLEDYIKSRKDTYMDRLIRPFANATEELSAVNIKDSIAEFSNSFIESNGYVITESGGNDFIKINDRVFKKMLDESNGSLYAPLINKADNTVYFDVTPEYNYNEETARKVLSRYNRGKGVVKKVKEVIEDSALASEFSQIVRGILDATKNKFISKGTETVSDYFSKNVKEEERFNVAFGINENTPVEDVELGRGVFQTYLNNYPKGNVKDFIVRFNDYLSVFNERLSDRSERNNLDKISFQEYLRKEKIKNNLNDTTSINEVVSKLKETGLANDVISMTSQEMDSFLKDLGINNKVRKQIVSWRGTRKAVDALEVGKFESKYGELLDGTYFGDLGVALAFSGYDMFMGSEKSSRLFKAKFDESNFAVVDAKGTTPRLDKDLIKVIGIDAYNDLLRRRKSGEINGLIIKNAPEHVIGEKKTTQYVVFDNSLVDVVNEFRGDALNAIGQAELRFQEDGVRMTPNGFVYGGNVYLNSETATVDTPIHEFAHLYNDRLKVENPALYNQGLKLIESELGKVNSPIQSAIDYVKETQPNLEDERLHEEILAQLVGERGLNLLGQNKRSKSPIIEWLRNVFNSIKDMLGLSKMTINQAMSLGIKDYADTVAVDLLSGDKLFPNSKNEGYNFDVLRRNNQYLTESDFNSDGTVKESVLKEIAQERADIERLAKENGTWLEAPNGADSNLSEEQWITTRSKRFRTWFGEWNIKNEDYEQQAREIESGRAVFERFSQKEQSGFARGGKIHVEASLILGANEGAGGQILQREEQEGRIEQYAKEKGVWIDNTDVSLSEEYGTPLSKLKEHGNQEASIWVSNKGGYVVKSQNTAMYNGNLQEKLDSITLHNTYFPESNLLVKGFGRDENGLFQVIVEQPFIGGDIPSFSDLREYLEKIGFTNEVSDLKFISNDGQFILEDVHNRNAVELSDGNIIVIDPIMRLNTEDKGYGGKRVLSNNIVAKDVSKVIDENGEPLVVYHGTTNEFYEFDSSVKGNIEGHLGKVHYFTTYYSDAEGNYLSTGADITSRIERRVDEIEYDVENLTSEEVSEIYNIDVEDVENKDAREVAKDIARKELIGGTERVLEFFVNLKNPITLGGNKSIWFNVDNFSQEDYNQAKEEIAEEYDVSLEEVEDEYSYDVRQRAIYNSGYEGLHIEALKDALRENDYDENSAYDILGDLTYEDVVDLNSIEKVIRNAGLYENNNNEMASSQVIADFFEKLGFDGIILDDVSDRFSRMGLTEETKHIHIFDQYKNKIKSATDNVGTFSESSNDIRYQILGKKGAEALDRFDNATQRLDNLSVARDMEQSLGLTLEDWRTSNSKLDLKRKLKMATSWERGADGKWRYELNDTTTIKDFPIKFNDKSIYFSNLVGNYKLSDIISDENLFIAYPQLKDMGVVLYDDQHNPLDALGAFYGNETFYLNYDEFEYLKRKENKFSQDKHGQSGGLVHFLSVFKHEIQHAIQDVEGFGRGASFIGIAQDLRKRVEGVNSGIETRDSFKRNALNDFGINEIDSDKLLDNSENESLIFNISKSIYNKSNGEVESRNVQKRLGFSPQQRKETLLEETEDVARQDQIDIVNGISEADYVSNIGENSVVEQQDLEQSVNDLIEQGGVEMLDEDGNPCAERGVSFNDIKLGGKWSLEEDLQGFPRHRNGGVDISLGRGGVSIYRGASRKMKAEHGLYHSSKSSFEKGGKWRVEKMSAKDFAKSNKLSDFSNGVVITDSDSFAKGGKWSIDNKKSKDFQLKDYTQGFLIGSDNSFNQGGKWSVGKLEDIKTSGFKVKAENGLFIEYDDNPITAEHGLALGYRDTDAVNGLNKGGKWSIEEDLKGYPRHKDGGVDIELGVDGVEFSDGESEFYAEDGLLIGGLKQGGNWLLSNDTPIGYTFDNTEGKLKVKKRNSYRAENGLFLNGVTFANSKA